MEKKWNDWTEDVASPNNTKLTLFFMPGGSYKGLLLFKVLLYFYVQSQ